MSGVVYQVKGSGSDLVRHELSFKHVPTPIISGRSSRCFNINNLRSVFSFSFFYYQHASVDKLSPSVIIFAIGH